MWLQAILKSQYRSGLTMLGQAIESCPPDLWTAPEYPNPSWQVVYHTLFYTHLYLQPSEAEFVPWEHHRPGHHRFGDGPDAAEVVRPYSVAELGGYCQWCRELVDSAVDRLDLQAPDSGFPWYRMSKLEHQLVNLRHLQHHTGQLADRLRHRAGRGVDWVGGDTTA